MTWAGEADADAAVTEAAAASARQRRLEAWRSLAGALRDGARLALLGRPAAKAASAGTFWVVTALSVLASAALARLAVEEPRQFYLGAVQTEGFYVAVLLLQAWLVARWAGRIEQIWPVATLITAAALVATTTSTLVHDHLLDDLVERDARWFWLYMAVAVGWWIAIWRRALTALSLGPNDRQRAAVALLLSVGATSLYWQVGGDRFWHKDYAAEYAAQRANEPADALVAEEVFSAQPALMEAALGALAAQTPGQLDLYFVSFGGYGAQDVFMKESLYGARLFETRFGAAGRTLTLVNNEEKLAELPLASVTNLRQALDDIGRRIDRDEDLLFLFLTSHGSEDAELSVSLGGVDFKPLTAPVLDQLLDESGIRWRVVVVSACYSGSFLDALKDDHTLVITAARADRKSFGCSDEAEFTYFGRAYFQQALHRTTSFTEAFTIARGLVTDWEKAESQTPSEPQMATAPAIEARLEAWRRTLPP